MNLSKDVFERGTSTGSGFAHFLGQLVSIIVKTLRNTNLGASRCFKMKKTSLPVDVRRSKTPLLKLPNIAATTSCENAVFDLERTDSIKRVLKKFQMFRGL